MTKTRTETQEASINENANQLESIQNQQVKLVEDERRLIDNIRNDKKPAVVAFIDLVGSTQFKKDHTHEPEVWILRLRRFFDIITNIVQKNHGEVVKYIGDEVMAVFKEPSRVLHAKQFLHHLADAQAKLTEIIRTPTEIKIAIDEGEVYFFGQDGHIPLDPQGLPVDRAARIAKYCKPGTILSSKEFKNLCSDVVWSPAGEEIDLKGIGMTKMYQFGPKTVNVEELIEVPKKQLDDITEQVRACKNKLDDIEQERNNLIVQNQGLQKQVIALKATPDNASVCKTPENSKREILCTKINNKINELRKIIDDSDAGDDYARFLFLFKTGTGQAYNSWNNKFDRCIEKNLVCQSNDPFASQSYYINEDHRRNIAAIEIMSTLDKLLGKYEDTRENDCDLFTWSLQDGDFWKNQIGYDVVK